MGVFIHRARRPAQAVWAASALAAVATVAGPLAAATPAGAGGPVIAAPVLATPAVPAPVVAAPKWQLAPTTSPGFPGRAPLPDLDPSATAPAASSQVVLDGVSCAGKGFCVAVGDYEDDSGAYTALVETLSGGKWRALAPPEPAIDSQGIGPGLDSGGHAFSVLFAVSCPTVGYCTAVGSYHNAVGEPEPMVETLSHGSWHPLAPPPPGRDASGEPPSNQPDDAGLTAVDCYAPGSCVATGAYQDAAQYTYALIETLSDGKWRPTVAAQPARSAYGTSSANDIDHNQFAGLGSVSCPSAQFCVAAGYYKDANGASSGLIEVRYAGRWHSAVAPEPTNDSSGVKAYTSDGAGAYAALTDVACWAPWACTAVGSYRDSTAHNYGLVLSLAKGHWRASAAAEPGLDASGELPGDDADKKADAALTSVACPSANCVGVGFYKDSSGHFTGLVDQSADGSWSALVAPEPALDPLGGQPGNDGSGVADTTLNSVSCSSPTACAGVGDYNDAKGNSIGLIDMDISGQWQAVAAPVPQHQYQVDGVVREGVTLTSVSCTAEGTCAAVGNYIGSGGNTEGLIDSSGA